MDADISRFFCHRGTEGTGGSGFLNENFAGFGALRESCLPGNSLNVFYHEKHEMHEKFSGHGFFTG